MKFHPKNASRREIFDVKSPIKFKIPQLSYYEGKIDPTTNRFCDMKDFSFDECMNRVFNALESTKRGEMAISECGQRVSTFLVGCSGGLSLPVFCDMYQLRNSSMVLFMIRCAEPPYEYGDPASYLSTIEFNTDFPQVDSSSHRDSFNENQDLRQNFDQVTEKDEI
ncbi:hypothetical protein KFK09_012873 [Dendrobium nobile]|uniref:Uncharacterized protein n=1 Tax=Dendrobium nobile TaxID=94219 RepID=A0A8T3BKL7_DENNO|nr:hypothetical protein KFK09_012873 [Dendrobium nobile]